MWLHHRHLNKRWPAGPVGPPVSIITNSLSPQKARVYSRSRVTPGWSYTTAMEVPAMRLNSADLPTLGRPTIAILGRSVSGILSRRLLRWEVSARAHSASTGGGSGGLGAACLHTRLHLAAWSAL